MKSYWWWLVEEAGCRGVVFFGGEALAQTVGWNGLASSDGLTSPFLFFAEGFGSCPGISWTDGRGLLGSRA